MVHLDHLDVEIFIQQAGHLLGDQRQHVDAQAHIAFPHDGDCFRRLVDRRVILRRHAGGANHKIGLGLHGQGGMRHGRRRRREIQHHRRPFEHGPRVILHCQAQTIQTGQLAQIPAQSIMPRPLGAAGDGAALGRRDLPQQIDTHAPGTANHAKL